MMAGKDCTKAIAKWSIKDEDLNNLDLVNLKLNTILNLFNYKQTYQLLE